MRCGSDIIFLWLHNLRNALLCVIQVNDAPMLVRTRLTSYMMDFDIDRPIRKSEPLIKVLTESCGFFNSLQLIFQARIFTIRTDPATFCNEPDSKLTL